jgi:hypothetical protein
MLTKPTRPSVHIKKLNKTVYINLITIADEEWFKERFNDEELENDLLSGNVATILEIFWRLMDDEGKIAVRDCKIMGWDGFESVELKGLSPVEKLKRLISGGDEITAIVQGIFGSKEKAEPVKSENEKKKKTAAQSLASHR